MMQQCFPIGRLEQVVIHVGALSLKESQELVCTQVRREETTHGSSAFYAEAKINTIFTMYWSLC